MAEPTTAYIDAETVELLDGYINKQSITPSRSAVIRTAVKRFCHEVKK